MTSNIPGIYKDTTEYEDIIKIITHFQYCIVNDVLEVLSANNGSSDSILQLRNLSLDLSNIAQRMHYGKVRTGVVGVTKAGKSTVLNALLGKEYLPSSVQPQTAKEVTIIHDPQFPEGALYGNNQILLKEGRADIEDELKRLNDMERSGGSVYDSLVLRVAFPFLNESNEVNLELSDTPGLNEAGVSFTGVSEKAVKEMAAYIVILHVTSLKTKAESTLFRNLRYYHPELLKKLKRIIILVNAYDLTFKYDDPKSLKATNISNYVSTYLKNRDILGEEINPKYVIPISGLWALRAQEWLDDPFSLLEDSRGQTRYDEALNILDWAHYDITELKSGFHQENVKKACDMLYELSNFTILQQRLLEMLHKNSEKVLFESILDDISSKASNALIMLEKFEKFENIERKRELKSAYETLVKNFTSMVDKHTNSLKETHLDKSVRQAVSASSNALIYALKSSIKGIVNSKMMDYLRETQQHLNKTHVQSQILLAKHAIPETVLNKMKEEWVNIVKVIGEEEKNVLVSALSKFRLDLPGVVDFTLITGEIMPPIKRFTQSIAEMETTIFAFIPQMDTPSFDFEYYTNQDENIQNIQEMLDIGTTQKIKTHRGKVCGGQRFIVFGSKKCKYYTVATPYDVPNYSPNFATLESAFSGVIKRWTEVFKKETDDVIIHTTQEISSQLLPKLTTAAMSVKKDLEDLLHTSNKVLVESENTIMLLQSKYQLVQGMRNKVRMELNELS